MSAIQERGPQLRFQAFFFSAGAAGCASGAMGSTLSVCRKYSWKILYRSSFGTQSKPKTTQFIKNGYRSKKNQKWHGRPTNLLRLMYVSFIGLRLTKTSLTLINRTQLRTKGQSETTHSSAVRSLHLSQCFTPPLKSIPASFFPHSPCPPSWIPSLPAISTPVLRMCHLFKTTYASRGACPFSDPIWWGNFLRRGKPLKGGRTLGFRWPAPLYTLPKRCEQQQPKTGCVG